MNKLILIIFILFNLLLYVTCNDPLGCGGFIKSHVPIEFSKVEVKLLTKQGILKDKITCAPTNGYYFVPVYDKGEYVLELEPPAGWSFTPTRVSLTIDGKNDLCSQGKDIDFTFQGFGITGKVESFGDYYGPEGVEVELKSATDTRNTKTDKDGSFSFTPVYPGTYQVSIVNTKWKLWKDTVNVTVTEGNTVLPPHSLVIQGYEVTGFMINQGVPIKDTIIVLFQQQGQNDVKVDGCIKGLTNDKFTHPPLCYVKSNSQGEFKFSTVPNGEYYIMPFYTEDNINYQPKRIDFTVEHNDVQLQQSFEITGFSVRGMVRTAPDGKPIEDAKIYLNGQAVARTNKDGIFKLEKIKAGSYEISAHANGFQFKEQFVEINPNSKTLPDLIPSAYEICGNVLSDKPESISFTKIGSTFFLSTLSEPESGNFCDYVPAGKYDVQVMVSEEDARRGIQFYPPKLTINVQYGQVYDISFSQLKATIRGKVQCLQLGDCPGVKVILRPREVNPDKQDTVVKLKGYEYEIRDVYPGAYDVIILNNKLCWEKNKQPIDVNTVTINVPTFIQIGYSVIFVSSHDAEIEYKKPGKETVENAKISKGRTVHCVEKPGVYEFEIKGCHIYENNKLTFDSTTGLNEFFLNALKHAVTIYIKADKDYGDVTVTIDIEGSKTQKIVKFTDKGYKIDLFLGPGEKTVITPQSDILYFNPPILNIDGAMNCEDLGQKFDAILGIVFEGSVTPPLAGVQVTVEDENMETITTETNAEGHYKIPPLDRSKKYKVTAKKDSYVINGPDEKGNFFAHKLAEIVIEVLDKDDNSPLVGTLLSLSGGESYRSNLQTDENGKIVFSSISPGEYFLRPMMKEYNFEPSSKIITVKEGEVVNVRLSGKKVAYSVFGEVVSLNGEPEENIAIVATGIGNCSHFSEESTSESNGKFRIRGLQPYCSYTINVNNKGNQDIERIAPGDASVKNIHEDVKNLRLVIFRPITTMDLLLKIYAKNLDHYKVLRIKLIRESPPATLYVGKIDMSTISLNEDYNYGVMVQLPQIPSNGQQYTLQFESTQNQKWDMQPYTFVANSTFQYFEFKLKMKKDNMDQDIKQISLGIVLILCIILLGIYRFDIVKEYFNILWEYTEQYSSQLRVQNLGKRTNERDYPMDNDDIDQIVQSINAVKKKPKSKKIQ